MAKTLKQTMRRLCMAFACVSVTASMTACAAPAWDGQGAYYDFNWRVSGNAAIAPVQVFDDGSKIYLQFPQGATLPAIFEDGPAGPILVAPTQQLPYFVLDRFAGRLQFRMGTSIAYAQRDVVAGSTSAPASVYTGTAAPAVVTGSAPMPVSRTQYLSAGAAATSGAGSGALMTVSPPNTLAPAPASNAALPPAALAVYTLVPEDGTVGAAFSRWSRDTGWSVSWKSASAARITGLSQIPGPLLHAVIAVVDALKRAGYPITQQWDLPNQQISIVDAASGPFADVVPEKTTTERSNTVAVRRRHEERVLARRRPSHRTSLAALSKRRGPEASPAPHAAPSPTVAKPEPLHAAINAAANASIAPPAAASNVRSAPSQAASSVFDIPMAKASSSAGRSAF